MLVCMEWWCMGQNCNHCTQFNRKQNKDVLHVNENKLSDSLSR